jgi:SAM-dependent methyltransferase
VSDAVGLVSTRCAICKGREEATEVYPANFSELAFNPDVFSARRFPDRLHYRIVRCNACGLVRSDPVGDAEALARLYAQSGFDYSTEVENLRQTYGRYLARLSRWGAGKGTLLEVGCGNGFFLEEALRQGYASVQGIEPSRAAVAQAHPRVAPGIICDILRPGLVPSETVDVVCLFQVFDHVPHPNALLTECARLLKPGGLILCINHNIAAPSARLLGERSPIIDIEHTYLYDPRSMRVLFAGNGFKVLEAGSVRNTYSVAYLAQLLPIPNRMKQTVMDWLRAARLGRVRLSLPLGNLYLVGQRPRTGA